LNSSFCGVCKASTPTRIGDLCQCSSGFYDDGVNR
jgi:hypothetical protein